MYKAIIIDDEKRARTLLSGMLKEYATDIEVLAECEDLPNGVKAIRKHKPQLVFLDIEMPGHSGLELLDFFNEDEIDFDIIFTTAYNNYAIQAFKLSAIDYLLKPIGTEELENALIRFRKKIKKKAIDYTLLKENLNTLSSNKIAVPVGNSIKFIELDTILYFKSDSSYTEIMFEDNSKLVVSRTLKNFEEVLSTNKSFFRCHKSYYVNVNFIVEYVKSDGGYIILKNNSHVSISPDKTDELMEMLKLIKR